MQLTNVAKATEASDAVNLGQLQEAGLDVDPSGNVRNSFVAYDDAKKDSVTFGGKNPNAQVALHNVAAGAQDADAVNVSQLKAAGLDLDPSGNVKNSFVAYDDAKKDSVTLGGKNPGAPVALHNVAKATSAGDAVNLAQLQEAGLDVDPSGNVKNSFVAYDDEKKDSVTFGGKNPNAQVALHNVAAGAQDLDAVNVLQLKAAGLDLDPSGNVKNSFVAYDDEKKDSVTFGGKNPNAQVALHNVAAGAQDADAVNVSQLKAAGLDLDPSGNVKNSFVAYDDAKKDSVTLGGKNPGAPVALHNVAKATSASDAVNLAQLQEAGLDVDPSGNVKNSFVAYDDAKKDSVTFGGTTPGAQAVALHNVAAGAKDLDAVNVSQLKAAGLDLDSSGNVRNSFVAYDDTSKTSVTLGGKNPKAPVALHNVAKATSAGDAVNLAQLQEAGLDVDPSGNVKNSFVAYDDAKKDSVTFGGTTPGAQAVALHNVAAGAKDLDAVNVLQLKAAGLDLDPSGNVKNSFVAYDNALKSQITLGGSGGTVITNVKAGSITDTSTDAVNGSGANSTAIGDMANASASNSLAAGGGATASGANSTAIGDMANASASNSVALGANSVADRAASNSVALGANSVADRANSVSVGAAGSERQITNVADGKAPTDAVNMRQLQSVQSSMTSLQRGAYGGVAAATALTMIPDVDAGKTIAVGIGTANYKGYQATALGASARVTQNLKVKVGAGYSAGNTTVGGGMSYQW